MRKSLKKAREKKDRMFDRVDSFLHRPSRSSTPEARTAWAGLEALGGALKACGDMFGPLKAAVEAISGCVEVYEVHIQIVLSLVFYLNEDAFDQNVAKSREDYRTLRTDLEAQFMDLAVHFNNPVPPTMTSSIENLARQVRLAVWSDV
jgi:hypothetical protein